MDGTKPGEAGVIAWCNSIRFSMAKDPGRQFLHEQIQEGFDFLDMYLENFLNGPKHEYVPFPCDLGVEDDVDAWLRQTCHRTPQDPWP